MNPHIQQYGGLMHANSFLTEDFMELMDVFKEKINVVLGLVTGFLTLMFGPCWWAFAAFLALNAADFITGWAKARYTGSEDSAKGAHGIWKKAGYWLIIAISFFIGACFIHLGSMFNADLEFLQFIGWFTLASYIINECRSVLENIVVIQSDKHGAAGIPWFLIKGLNVAQKLLDDRTNALGGKEEALEKSDD